MRRPCRHNRAFATPGGKYPVCHEFQICFNHGSHVDVEIPRLLPDSRNTLARL